MHILRWLRLLYYFYFGFLRSFGQESLVRDTSSVVFASFVIVQSIKVGHNPNGVQTLVL
jgi:hypothetical protein